MDVSAATSKNVDSLGRESTGGRVRFSTDSPYIAIRVKYLKVGRYPTITQVATASFDLYVDGEFGSRYAGLYETPLDMEDSNEQIVYLEQESLRSYTVNFPIHSTVQTLEIGLKPNAKLEAPSPYRDILPIVFYGSSIVHGASASRPGCIYPAVISRELNVDFRSMGFSGNAKGEQVLARWMATLPMSIFVCDYDYNASTPEILLATHYAIYETVREKNPTLPYIMITRPNYWPRRPSQQEETLQRRDIIMTSYLKARATGDRNVYFIDGMSFFTGPNRYEMTVDTVHPTDAGFLRMAEQIGGVIKHVLEKRPL